MNKFKKMSIICRIGCDYGYNIPVLLQAYHVQIPNIATSSTWNYNGFLPIANYIPISLAHIRSPYENRNTYHTYQSKFPFVYSKMLECR